jgi:hypothetical protein
MINRNQSNGISLSQVHQKSNKFKFVLRNTSSIENPSGYGLYLYDTGIFVEDCQFMLNEAGGVYASNVLMITGDKTIPDEIKLFLERFPMIVHFNRCDLSSNDKSGAIIEDYWKGPMLFSDCKFNQNKHSGLIVSAVMQPAEHSSFNKTYEASSIMINGPIVNPRKLQRSTTTASASNAKVAPSTIFNEESKLLKVNSSYQNPMKNL